MIYSGTYEFDICSRPWSEWDANVKFVPLGTILGETFGEQVQAAMQSIAARVMASGFVGTVAILRGRRGFLWMLIAIAATPLVGLILLLGLPRTAARGTSHRAAGGMGVANRDHP